MSPCGVGSSLLIKDSLRSSISAGFASHANKTHHSFDSHTLSVGAMGVFDSVGTLLADIANIISDGQRILSLSDKRHWGQDEREQERALNSVLDEARKDFQELGPLVNGNGRSQYEHDRRRECLC